MKYSLKITAFFLMSMIITTMLLMGWARYSAQNSIEKTLSRQLPLTVEVALINTNNRQDLFRLSTERMQQALNKFVFDNATMLPIIKNAYIEQFSLHDAEDSTLALSELPGQLLWRQGGMDIAAAYRLSFNYDLVNLLIQSLIIVLMGFGAMKLFLDMRRYSQNDWLSILKAYKFDQREAEQLAQITEDTPFFNHLLRRVRRETPLNITQITELIQSGEVAALEGETLSWFIAANRRGLSVDQSLAIAFADDSLSFDLDSQELLVHGLTIPLSKTPLFYYFWYAKRKIDNLGPFLNPAQSKPDPVAGAELAALMDAHHGHLKAIHDLEGAGLKGKTLDQNRNKIKDELSRLLGDELAARYLFNSARDPKTARYLYELALPANFIRL